MTQLRIIIVVNNYHSLHENYTEIMTDETEGAKFEMPGVEFDHHSFYYSDFFLLKTSKSVNGCPAEIKEVKTEPVLWVKGVSIKLSTITNQAVAPALNKLGVYRVETNFYCMQHELLYEIKFHSKSSLEQFLIEKVTVQKELELAIAELWGREGKSTLSQFPSSEDIKVVVDIKVYLLSPRDAGHPPEVIQVNLANRIFVTQKWKRSKQFEFSSTLFNQKADSKYKFMTDLFPKINESE